MSCTGNRYALTGGVLLAVVLSAVEPLSARDDAAAAQPTRAPASGLRVTVTYPTFKDMRSPSVVFHDGHRKTDLEQVKNNTAVFPNTPRKGAWIQFSIIVANVRYKYKHVLSAEEVRSRTVKWAVPLDPAKHYVTCRVTNKATKQPIARACVIARRVTAHNSSTMAHTDAEGMVTVRVNPQWDMTVECVRVYGGPGLGLVYIKNVARVPVKKDRSAKTIIELPVDVPPISLKVKVELKTQTGTKALTGRDGSVQCRLAVLPRRGGGYYHAGLTGTRQTALLVDLPPGEYLLHMEGARDRNKYATVSPQRVVVEKGKTKEVTLVVQSADEYRGRFAGSVAGPKGPLAGAEVRLERIKGGYAKAVKTDRSGAFVFTDVPGGPCRLVADAREHRTFTTEVTVPSVPLKVELYRAIQLRVNLNGEIKAKCVLFYQGKQGQLRERTATTDVIGVATFTLSSEGPYLLWAFTADRSKAAEDLIRVEGDSEIARTLQPTENVVLNVVDGKRVLNGPLIFVGADTPSLVPGRLSRNVARVDLLPGAYDVFLRQGKDAYLRIASKWVVPDGGRDARIAIPKKPGAPESLSEIFRDLLKNCGVKPVKIDVRKPTTQPAGAKK